MRRTVIVLVGLSAAIGAAALYGERPVEQVSGRAPIQRVPPAVAPVRRHTDLQEPPRSPAIKSPSLVVVGVIASGRSVDSRALIEIGGLPAQEFGPGEALVSGWVIGRITPDKVVLKNGGSELALPVTGGRPSEPRSVEAAAVARATASSAGAMPMGFSAGTPGLGITAGAAHESNQRFLQAMQQRRRAGTTSLFNR